MISKQPNLVPASELQEITHNVPKASRYKLKALICACFSLCYACPYLNVWNADFFLLISSKLLRNLTTATSLCNAYLTIFAREERTLMELIRNLEIDEKR